MLLQKVLGGVAVIVVCVSCADPCVALAERICRCEPTPIARRSCEAERVTPREDGINASPEEQQRCLDALDTCTCAALDENRVELCGFTREGDEPE